MPESINDLEAPITVEFVNEEPPDPVYVCHRCGEEWSDEDSAYDCCRVSCEECGESYEYEEDAIACCRQQEGSSGYVPDHIMYGDRTYEIEVPVIPGRPARMCSIEQELTTGGGVAATLMYELGFCDEEGIVSYSYTPGVGRVAVKEDGSLPYDGGEVVYDRLSLDRLDHQRIISESMHRIRKLREDGLVRTNTAAGTHIHISITPVDDRNQVFGPGQMAALYEIFSHLEDLLFRLAAAGWSAHRGDGYSQRLINLGKVTPGKIVKDVTHMSRYFSINFERLLSAARNCRCGCCSVGDWDECNCGALSAGTVEWRVFNATTKAETMHAWLLLAHSLTAKAFDYQLGTLEPNPFETSDPDHQDLLEWILMECPLSEDEKRIIVRLAERSPGLNITDWEELHQLVGITNDKPLVSVPE